MSEQNKNRNKDKGKQRNTGIKYDTTPKSEQERDVEFAADSEFLNLDNKKNKRKRK
jgi:hypothetical protein